MVTSSDTLISDLREAVQSKRALILVGAGVTSATIDEAEISSWPDLLKHGLARIVGLGRLSEKRHRHYLNGLYLALEDGDTEGLLEVAGVIQRNLDGSRGGEYRKWLRESVGQLQVADAGLVEAIHALGCPIATTNYDTLIHQITGLPSVPWTKTNDVQRLVRGEDQGVLHLHGLWHDAETVIFSQADYQGLINNPHVRAVQEALAMVQQFVLIGFGSGLDDPNFALLRRWLATVMPHSEARHFRLARNAEVADLQKKHPPGERTFVLGYGEQHQHLPLFLHQLVDVEVKPRGPGKAVPFFHGPLVPIAYRDRLERELAHMDPPPGAKEPLPLRLRRVYVPLVTNWLEPERRKSKGERGEKGEKLASMAGEGRAETRRPLADLLNLARHRHFVILGGPGSGKTTFLSYTALTEMDQNLGLLPLLLPLKEFGNWLAGEKGERGELLPAWAGDFYAEEGLPAAQLRARSGKGRLVWLLDGLDEIFAENLRLRAAEVIGRWFASARGREDRLLLTTRPHALQQTGIPKALALESKVHRLAILGLGEEEQHLFLARWFRAYYGESGEDKEKGTQVLAKLWSNLEDHPFLTDLRTNPLTLATIALIYQMGGRLPERRVELYKRAIDVLLRNRFGPRAGGDEDKVVRMRRGLMAVSLEMMRLGKARRCSRDEFIRCLGQGYFGHREITPQEATELENWARELGTHSGLLNYALNPTGYSFRHLGFQEYLAARQIADERKPFKAVKDHLDQGFWREVIMLTAGCLLDPEGVVHLGQDFLRDLVKASGQGQTRCSRLALAAQAAAEAPATSLTHELKTVLTIEAVATLATPNQAYPEKERQSLGLALGRLGDPRLGMERQDRWAWVRPGRFTMGDDKSGQASEKPAHQVEMTHGFWMGRFAVTNEEYRRFVAAGGYQERQWWSDAGWAWRMLGDEDFEQWYRELHKKYTYIKKGWPGNFRAGNEPRFWEFKPFNGGNQPVVGVSWYEAEAYCRWLDARWRKQKPGWLKRGWQVRLPRETEWEYAARGEAGRTYPWGEKHPTGEFANFSHSLDQTTAVGTYPMGKTPVTGIHDLAGNIWEWCLDLWDDSAYQGRVVGKPPGGEAGPWERRALRGGAWTVHASHLRCSFRDKDFAAGRYAGVSFRLVVVPERGY